MSGLAPNPQGHANPGPRKQSSLCNREISVDLKVLSLSSQTWIKSPCSSELIHSLHRHLLSAFCMPGTMTGVTLQSSRNYCVSRYTRIMGWGRQVLQNSSSQPDVFFQWASNSNRTLPHLPKCPGNTLQVCSPVPRL